jgi:protein-disulfide isomerase
MTASRLSMPVNTGDHIRGPKHAPVTMVEYGDFECPHCGRAHLIIEGLHKELGDKMRFVYRHFPLTLIHPHAQHAAEASEIAGAHGEFWRMHGTLFTHQRALDDAHLVQYAASVGLDVALFTRELASHAFEGRVRRDFISGVRSGVNGTPTFFLNEIRYDGPHDFESLVAAIDMVAEVASVRRTS